MKRAVGVSIVVLLLLSAVTAGAWFWRSRPSQVNRLPVVATFYPLYEFARHVGGDRVEVLPLVPVGIEPHDWEPTPQDLTYIRRARLLIYNGAGLEPWVERLVPNAAGPNLVVVNSTEKISLKAADLLRHDDPTEKKNAARDPRPDPHVWLDPVLAQAQVQAIRDGLIRADPENAATYDANARAFIAKLAELHREFERGLATCARRELVTTHAAFSYLAARYHLTMVPIMGLGPEAEPNPAELARIVELARRNRIRYVFVETLVSPKLAETLAREVGASTLVLNPIEGLTKDEVAGGRNYLSLMRENLDNLRAGLGCR